MKKGLLISLIILGALIIAGVIVYIFRRSGSVRDPGVVEWINNPQKHPEWLTPVHQQCANAPFSFPTDGYIGYLWDDNFQPFHRHQGIDIFGAGQPGVIPVYAVYPGYVTRLPGWKSSLIIRIPQDPLQSGRQIWTYYTHMADPQGNSFISNQFPPGTSELFVPTGTLLGYQGNYSGNPGDPVGVHLHFSIVRDNQGKFLNELDINNTLDPSPYFGMPLNAASQPQEILPVCLP